MQCLFYYMFIPIDNIGPSVEAAPQYPALGNSYYFVPPEPTTTTYTRDFYRVTNTYFVALV